MRSKAYSTIFVPLLTIICIIGFIDTAAADNSDHDNRYGGNKKGALAKAEIEELMSCYAYSFDAINRAVTATYSDFFNLEYLDPRNMADPNFAEGYERFRGCTTSDFVIEIYNAKGTELLPGDFLTPGPLPWVNLVNAFRAPDDMDSQSQHLFGSLSTTVHGRTGTLKAYATISGSRITADGELVKSGPGTSTYTSDVVYKRGKWLLKKITLVENNLVDE